MAIQFAAVEYIQRSKGGNVCRSAAYNSRGDVRCERTGERFFFAHRDPTRHSEVLLPEGADTKFLDPVVLWNDAQAMEKRRDSQEGKHLLLALPSDPGLSLDDWKVMCREFVHEHFVSKGVAAQLDIHDPHDADKVPPAPAFGKGDVNLNYHAHVLITTRRIEGSAFSTHKARDLDPEVRTMKGKAKIVTEAERWGELWRDYQNSYFERQGLELRVDATGFVGQRHEGPVRLRTVPEQSKARLDEALEANIAAARDPEKLLAKLTEHRATFTEMDIERLTRKYLADPIERAEIRKAVLALPEVLPLYGRETGAFAGRYTTAEVRTEEREALDHAARVARSRRAPDPSYVQAAAAERSLDEEQYAAFVKGTGTDGLVVIEGLAGTGKSYSLNAIREAHERAGWDVVGAAPTNAVAADMRRSGFKEATSVHYQVWWQERGGRPGQKWGRDTLVIVDEAGMLDSRIYARLMKQAAEKGAKVILAGDDRQQGSVQRGGLFTEIKQRHGSSVISKVRRQEQAWQREASEDFAQGRMAEGLRAYAERGHVHWSKDIQESRDRLLSDWDQDSRERPDINRFVYASTNAQVNQINRAIHDIRLRRGEISGELEVETVKGPLAIGTGERIQFHGNERSLGIVNGALGTISAIKDRIVTVETDFGTTVSFDTRTFTEFGLGYAGTVYRGPGKTQTEVYALYDHRYAWNARTAYVGLTRHTDRVELYVSTDLAGSEVILAEQMARRFRDGASLEWATRAEIVDLQREREERGRGGRGEGGGGDTAGGGSGSRGRTSQGFRDAETEALRCIDLTAYARDIHGYAVEPHPSGEESRFLLVRVQGQREERLEVRIAEDGHWSWRDLDHRRRAGDIFDLARQEGASNLTAAREAVAAYDEAMRATNRRQREAEERARIEIDGADPDAALKQAGIDAQRRLDILGAEHEDRREAAGQAEEERQAYFRDQAARLQREAEQANKTEQEQLRAIDEASPRGQYPEQVEEYVQAQARLAADAQLEERAPQRQAERTPEPEPRIVEPPSPPGPPPPEPPRAHEQTAEPELPPPTPERYTRTAIGVPTPAQLRYTEALNSCYDERMPIASLARASLREAATWQRDRHELDQRIAAEADPARREALLLRRDIEHADHMAQAYDRIAQLARATATVVINDRADDREPRERADQYKKQAADTRELWTERGKEHPDLYAALNPERERTPETARQPEPKLEPREPRQELTAMRELNLPEYAANQHGYTIEWANEAHTSANLTKDNETLRVIKGRSGWSYRGETAADRGDIVDFEINRGAVSADAARDRVRPELARVEHEQGRLDLQHERDRQRERQRGGMERGLGREL